MTLLPPAALAEVLTRLNYLAGERRPGLAQRRVRHADVASVPQLLQTEHQANQSRPILSGQAPCEHTAVGFPGVRHAKEALGREVGESLSSLGGHVREPLNHEEISAQEAFRFADCVASFDGSAPELDADGKQNAEHDAHQRKYRRQRWIDAALHAVSKLRMRPDSHAAIARAIGEGGRS